MDTDKNNGIYRIIGIDPGTETLGVSVLDLNLSDLSIKSCKAFTLIGSQSEYFDKETARYHSHRQARLEAHRQNLFSLFNELEPSLVCIESPFYNPRRPNAFAPLVETLLCVREALLRYDWHMKLSPLDPPRVKKAIGAKGNAGKDDVKIALEKHLSELKLDKAYFEELDEHSVDAICVAYAHYWKVKEIFQNEAKETTDSSKTKRKGKK